jgi:hypothetical protein
VQKIVKNRMLLYVFSTGGKLRLNRYLKKNYIVSGIG